MWAGWSDSIWLASVWPLKTTSSLELKHFAIYLDMIVEDTDRNEERENGGWAWAEGPQTLHIGALASPHVLSALQPQRFCIDWGSFIAGKRIQLRCTDISRVRVSRLLFTWFNSSASDPSGGYCGIPFIIDHAKPLPTKAGISSLTLASDGPAPWQPEQQKCLFSMSHRPNTTWLHCWTQPGSGERTAALRVSSRGQR